jgi:hypothetical protein
MSEEVSRHARLLAPDLRWAYSIAGDPDYPVLLAQKSLGQTMRCGACVIRAVMVHVLGAPLSACRRIDIEPLSITDFSSDGRRWMLRASGVTGAKPGKAT